MGGTYTYEFFLADHLGNTRIVHNSAGTVLQQLDYMPFGLDITRYQAVPNKYKYNGKEKQEELNQYDYGARFYDPAIGRWWSVDPLASKMSGYTPYGYAFNNPIRFIDVDGLIPYPITIRAFAPFKEFGFGYHSDNRGYSTANVSARVHQRINLLYVGAGYQDSK